MACVVTAGFGVTAVTVLVLVGIGGASVAAKIGKEHSTYFIKKEE